MNKRIVLSNDGKKLSFDEVNYIVTPIETIKDDNLSYNVIINSNGVNFWKPLEDVIKVRSVSGISPSKGNVDLSSIYYTKSELKNNFVQAPLTSSSNENLLVVLYNPESKESYHIQLKDLPKLREYKTTDNTLMISGDEIYINVSNVEKEVEIEEEDVDFPIVVDLDQNYSEISELFINGYPIPKRMYGPLTKSSIEILEDVLELPGFNNGKFFIKVKGIKFLN